MENTNTNNLPHITFVIRDIEGGVASMNHQIIENAPFDKAFNVHIILWRSEQDTEKEFKGQFLNAVSVRRFKYSKLDNYYQVLKRFSVLLNEWPGALVTNDGMELAAIKQMGTPSIVFSIVHDFYNLKLAVRSIELVDYFICHTETFTRTLQSSYVLRDRAKFILHGVKLPPSLRTSQSMATETGLTGPHEAETGTHDRLRIISVSRLTESKGVLHFFAIDELLRDQGVDVEWIVIGSGEAETALRRQWEGRDNIRFHQPDTMEEVYQLIQTADVFISPSSFEGYGIALLEAMACGLVPVVHKLPIGVYADLPPDSGFSIGIGDLRGFADCIAKLDKQKELLQNMGKNARLLVEMKYDIVKTAGDFLNWFASNSTTPRIDRTKPFREIAAMGFLDRPFIPNVLSRFVKKIRS